MNSLYDGNNCCSDDNDDSLTVVIMDETKGNKYNIFDGR
jgi:hypothetical protein